MRPITSSHAPYDPSRWRRQRSSDLRDIAVVFILAVVVNIGLFALASSAGDWFAGGETPIVAVIRGFLLALLYLGSGGIVAAFAAGRIAFWKGAPRSSIPTVRWYTIVIWPVFIGFILLRAAFAHWL